MEQQLVGRREGLGSALLARVEEAGLTFETPEGRRTIREVTAEHAAKQLEDRPID